MLAPPGPDARAASISRSASRGASKLFIGHRRRTAGAQPPGLFHLYLPHGGQRFTNARLARQSRTGLLDEVDGVPLALDRARLFLSGCRNSTLDEILTSALPAHPARALDHHIGRIAVFDIEPANLVEIQGSDFTGRVAKAFSVRAL